VTHLGVFGGAFDPVHIGHLLVAAEAVDALDLQILLIVPVADPPHRPARDLSAAAHRVAMLEIAFRDLPQARLARHDLDRPGPHYTADTLELIQADYPGAALHLVMGADQLRDFGTWHNPAAVVSRARLAVAGRPGISVPLGEVARAVPGIGEAVDWIHPPPVGVSASDIRARVAAGRSIRYHVTPRVEDYIRATGLYAAATIASNS
jgi:nicotinate-nucleotide adenylyltransferase